MSVRQNISGSMISLVVVFTLFACAKPKPEPVMPLLPAVTKNVPAATVVKDAYKYECEPALCFETQQFLAAEHSIAAPLPERAIKFDLQQLQPASEYARKEDSINSINSTNSIKSINSALTVFFDVNTSAMNESETRKLRHFIRKLPSAAEVEISGYTCRLGPDAYNQKLARDRAAAVAWIINKHGIRVRSATGMPGCCFISDTEPAKNRRAEIRVYFPVDTANDLKGGDQNKHDSETFLN